MTALEKLTLSRLEDRVAMLEETVHQVVGRLELVEQACCAVSDACATLLVRLDDVEMQLCDLKSHSRTGERRYHIDVTG